MSCLSKGRAPSERGTVTGHYDEATPSLALHTGMQKVNNKLTWCGGALSEKGTVTEYIVL